MLSSNLREKLLGSKRQAIDYFWQKVHCVKIDDGAQAGAIAQAEVWQMPQMYQKC